MLLAAYVPVLPKHIWEKYSLEQIANAEAEGFFANDPPVVGTGPYTAVEFEPGQFMRFARNPNYWGKQGAAEELIITHFENNDTMVQALRNGEIDYARGVSADAFDSLAGQPDIVTVEGAANGYSYLTFNGYSKPIPDGGASTTAVADPAFRDAPRLGRRPAPARRPRPGRSRHTGHQPAAALSGQVVCPAGGGCPCAASTSPRPTRS